MSHCSRQLRISLGNWELYYFLKYAPLYWIIFHYLIIVVIPHFTGKFHIVLDNWESQKITLFFEKCFITPDNFPLYYYGSNSTFHRKISHCIGQLRIPLVNWELHYFLKKCCTILLYIIHNTNAIFLRKIFLMHNNVFNVL